MNTKESKYTDEMLRKAVKSARSFCEVQKLLNAGRSGSCYVHFKKRIINLGIDVSHFTPRWNNKNNGGKNKRHYLSILIKNKNKEKSHRLRRAILESGIKYQCNICGIVKWLDKKITLQVDHINGNNCDNRLENLRFLCLNCHSQTGNYGFKGKNIFREV